MNAVIYFKCSKCLANYPNRKKSQSELTATEEEEEEKKVSNIETECTNLLKKFVEIGVVFTFYHAQRNQWTLFK